MLVGSQAWGTGWVLIFKTCVEMWHHKFYPLREGVKEEADKMLPASSRNPSEMNLLSGGNTATKSKQFANTGIASQKFYHATLRPSCLFSHLHERSTKLWRQLLHKNRKAIVTAPRHQHLKSSCCGEWVISFHQATNWASWVCWAGR